MLENEIHWIAVATYVEGILNKKKTEETFFEDTVSVTDG